MLNRQRLYWQCRRGLLELDILLERFLDVKFEGLTVAEQLAFVELLDYPDAVLLEYMLGRMIPTDQSIANVVTKIRAPLEG